MSNEKKTKNGAWIFNVADYSTLLVIGQNKKGYPHIAFNSPGGQEAFYDLSATCAAYLEEQDSKSAVNTINLFIAALMAAVEYYKDQQKDKSS